MPYGQFTKAARDQRRQLLQRELNRRYILTKAISRRILGPQRPLVGDGSQSTDPPRSGVPDERIERRAWAVPWPF